MLHSVRSFPAAMTAKKLPTLAEVDAYPVPELLTPRIMRKYSRDKEYAEGILREAKRMLYLGELTGKPVTPSEEIDDAWHEMILFSPYYFKLCRFLGTDYIHHEPEPETPAGSAGTNGPSQYDETIALYEKQFGVKADQRYWTP